MATDVENLVFVGFNRRIAALNRNTGEIVWDWKAPKPMLGGGYVSLLLVDDRQLVVSVSGYTYSLDPATGMQHWFNELEGFGSGVASVVALNQRNPHDVLLAAAAADAAAGAAAAAGGS
jgi:outer membrane protein assembly factor BamB